MGKKKFFISMGAGVFLLASLTAHAEGDPEAGRKKAELCAGCHGISGWRNAYPAYAVPKLGGQHAAYLVSALKAYKSGARNHPPMQGSADSLSEQDMADIAAFLSAQ
ncbi:c-type cytochrome [Nitrosococcus watsonii]|uniref:Cytochrome c, class I n=1 Tax=Nitrosococcus watsoni (strain C-113) TaxID=105559 RepID=D8K4L8_NITWC|nr:cytochrome c [Nitrosococcus watsonii]ADJ29820.1 cytochrome c, class I [Nitrosococcus watsonii C-113]